MTIEEALTDLSIQLEVKRKLGKNHQANALKLGIEALKRLYLQREHPKRKLNTLLVGETEGAKGKDKGGN